MDYQDLSHEARELVLYVENERAYVDWTQRAQSALARKFVGGTFDIERAPAAFLPMLASAARNYHMEHGSPWSSWHSVFPIACRREVAQLLAEQTRDIFRDPRVWGDLADDTRRILERHAGVLVTVTSIRRLNCSSAGNPRWQLATSELGYVKTSPNAACSYEVDNMLRNIPARGKTVRVWLTRSGQVEKMELGL